MPKREPTPPLDDDSKYLIINYPYPLHANMQIESERYDLAHWIASCVGQEYLTAIYHKPSAPNMVIIEIMKHCPRVNALLGAHKWREFLRKPEQDQVGTESRVYYCRYSTGREVQKHGWKRLDVWDSWFDDYDPVNGPFVTNPYPKASFCEVPPETQTDYSLCRPLPIEVFPRPKPGNMKPVVPGSDKYVEIKKSGGQPSVAPVPNKQPARSWASITSSNAARGSAPPAASVASSKNSNPATSPINASARLISSQPGLSPPPSLSASHSQASSECESYPSSALITPSDSSEWPGMDAQVQIITDSLAGASISYKEHDEQKAPDGKEEEQYWTEQPSRPTDWDKPICPEHKVPCRPGICKTMAEIERRKKREAQKAEKKPENNEDGWEQAKARGRGRGRGRGGQMRGRARGRARGW